MPDRSRVGLPHARIPSNPSHVSGGLLIELHTPSKEAPANPNGPTAGIQTILECISDGIVVADREGRLLLFNQAIRRMLGMGLADVPLKAWTDAYGLFLPDKVTPYPHDRLPLVRAIHGEEVLDAEIFVRNATVPEGVLLIASGRPWNDDAGVLHGGIALFRDVTAERQSRGALERLSNAVEQTADHIVITDTRGTILYTNPAFEHLSGYTRDEVYGHTPRLLKSGKQDASSYMEMWQTLLAGKVYRGSIVNRKQSGELYSSRLTITPMKDDSGSITHFVSVGKDLTDRETIEDRDIEMRLAGRVQKRLNPPTLRREGLDVAGATHPAKATGGDYYDYLTMPGGRLGIVVADVSGHDLGAALIMVATRAALRSCADIPIGLDEILDHVNTTLLGDLEPGRFVTMFLASLDAHAQSLTYSSAGHPPGHVLDRHGEIKCVMESTRIPLGVMANWKDQPTRSIPLERGDLLVFLTDGILESRGADGDAFGVENALGLVKAHRHESAQRILERLLNAVHTSRGNVTQDDDMTAVICKVGGA